MLIHTVVQLRVFAIFDLTNDINYLLRESHRYGRYHYHCSIGSSYSEVRFCHLDVSRLLRMYAQYIIFTTKVDQRLVEGHSNVK